MHPDRPTTEAVTATLAAAGCVAAAQEARLLVRRAGDEAELDAWVRRRELGEPLAWITGTTTFCGHDLVIARGVYVPRPQTEELARRAAAVLPSEGAALDLCTGSGAVAAHLARVRPVARIVGVDVDLEAAACARRNGVDVVVADLDAALGPMAFDVVTAVAPYVPTSHLGLLPADVRRHEPEVALDGGADGLDLVRRVAEAARRRLRPGGRLLLELGGDQDDDLGPHLAELGFEEVETWADDDGDLRGLAARAPGG